MLINLRGDKVLIKLEQELSKVNGLKDTLKEMGASL